MPNLGSCPSRIGLHQSPHSTCSNSGQASDTPLSPGSVQHSHLADPSGPLRSSSEGTAACGIDCGVVCSRSDISGKLSSLNGLNMASRSPISFTTNRNININGITFSCYDIDLNLYTKYITLDGYNIRQFRFSISCFSTGKRYIPTALPNSVEFQLNLREIAPNSTATWGKSLQIHEE